MWPPAQSVAIPTTTTDVQILGGMCLLMGWAFVETTGSAAATFDLYDGVGSGGQLVAPLSLSSGQSTRDLMTGSGIEIRGGLFLDMLTGSIKGAVWLIPGVRFGDVGILEADIPLWGGDR